MKGIVLAGGTGTRLHPITRTVSKQLLPVYDKPMVYYPLSLLMLAGLREILIITTPEDATAFHRLLGDGSHWGISLNYAVQEEPRGIAEAFLIGREFLAGGPAALVLGDNLLHGYGLTSLLRAAAEIEVGAHVLAYHVDEPSRFGVIEIDQNGCPLSLEEKPKEPRSSWAVPGIYFYDSRVSDLAAKLEPSGRGELEITDLTRNYLDEGTLKVTQLGRGYAWFDAGTPDALLEAAEFVRVVERRQDLMIACPEEIAVNQGYIDIEDLKRLAASYGDNTYGRFLARVIRDRQAKV